MVAEVDRKVQSQVQAVLAALDQVGEPEVQRVEG